MAGIENSMNGHEGSGLGTAVITKAKSAVPSEIGTTGLKQYGGAIAEEYFPPLRGSRGVATYTEMRDDPIIGGVLLAIENYVRRVDWTFDPPERDIPGAPTAGSKWADWMQTVIDDMESSWDDTVSEFFSMVPYGWSLHEPTFKRRLGPQPEGPNGLPYSDYDDGLIGWQGLPIRSQDSLMRWEIDANGRTLGMYQQLLTGSRYIPWERSLLFRTTSHKGSPEGRAALRSAHRPYFFRRKLEEFEAIGIERDLAGLPVGKLPSRFLSLEATDAEKATAQRCLQLVTKVRRNESEGFLWPLDYDAAGNELFKIELLSSGGGRQLSVTDAINRKNTEIAISILADWLLLGHQAVGAKALADPKVDVFMGALETWVNAVADVINSHGIPRLMRANGIDPRLSPKLRPSKVSQVDTNEFVTAVGRLADSGLLGTWSHADEDHVRVITGLPAREDTGTEAGSVGNGAPATAPTSNGATAAATDAAIPAPRRPDPKAALAGLGA